MAAGMYLEHYLDSKSRLKEGVRGHRGVGVSELRSSTAPKSGWSEGHDCKGLHERK